MISKYSEFEWIKKVILSCETPLHLVACTKLIHIFMSKYSDFLMANCLNYEKHNMLKSEGFHNNLARYSACEDGESLWGMSKVIKEQKQWQH